METKTTTRIESLTEFLAHAICLERESVEQYAELADCMETHNNSEVASLFGKLAEYGRLHAREVEEYASDMTLPRILPWDYKWTTPLSPESSDMDEIHYLMNQHDALNYALHNEERGRDFYARVAAESPDPEVQKLAATFAEEESEHVRLLIEWIERLPAEDDTPQEDFDPPHIAD